MSAVSVLHGDKGARRQQMRHPEAAATGEETPLGIPVLLFTGPDWGENGTRYPDGEAATAAWLAGAVTAAEFAAEVVGAVDADARAGVLPAGVSSIDDLRAHAEPNEYLMEVVGLDLSPAGLSLWDEVAGAVSTLLAARGPGGRSSGPGPAAAAPVRPGAARRRPGGQPPAPPSPGR
jgi:hypothetical protein